jgi:cytochrome c biogenesis protein CcdA/thiol-disulfide isomerase/thioredoxin
MLILMFFAFLAGIVTILSPCILPVLPIILSGSVTGSKKYPYGVVAGFILSFTFFTIFLSSIVKLTGISGDAVRNFAIVIIFVFGLVLIFPKLLVQFEILASKLVSKTGSNSGGVKRDGIWGGFIVGCSLGLIWTPCVGPILASVIALSISGTVAGSSLLIVLSYAIGTAIPMFAILYGGRQVINKVPGLLANLPRIQAIFGVIMILMSIALYFQVERSLQSYVLEKFPKYGAGLTAIENNSLVKKQLNQEDESTDAYAAPELVDPQNWINSNPQTLSELKGKVVLIDFWTYSCINCIRTIPYLEAWHQKYKDDGFVIIAVHTPEFEFEKNLNNLKKAVEDFGITYPVFQDNDFKTWRAYKNRFWPAKYLIDKDGNIVYKHFGEGQYDETEAVIVEELMKAGYTPKTSGVNVEQYQTFSNTPETYLNYSRIKNFASSEPIQKDKLFKYSYPNKFELNQVAYNGEWTFQKENSTPQANSSLKIKFDSKEVFLVARPKTPNTTGTFNVELNGKPYQNDQIDTKNGTVTVDSDKLYHLISLPNAGQGELELKFNDNNLEVYAFTFG